MRVDNLSKVPLKDRILENAVNLFYQKGFHGVTVDEIVEQAKASKGGFYHNFESKNSLLYEIHDLFISHLLKETKVKYSEFTNSLDRLYAMLHTFTKVLAVYQRHITVFYDEYAYLLPEYKQIMKAKRTEYRLLIAQVIEDGKRCGDFRTNISTSITSMSIIGMVNWSYKWYRPDGDLSMEEITEYFIDFILRGVLTEKVLQDAIQKGYVKI